MERAAARATMTAVVELGTEQVAAAGDAAPDVLPAARRSGLERARRHVPTNPVQPMMTRQSQPLSGPKGVPSARRYASHSQKARALLTESVAAQ